jgi:hypothetical protein
MKSPQKKYTISPAGETDLPGCWKIIPDGHLERIQGKYHKLLGNADFDCGNCVFEPIKGGGYPSQRTMTSSIWLPWIDSI